MIYNWLLGIRGLRGEFRPSKASTWFWRGVGISCFAFGSYVVVMGWKQLAQFPITLRQGKADVVIAALLFFGLYVFRRAGSWYRFDQGVVQELTVSGKVLWQEDLMTLEGVTWHPGKWTDRLTLKWPKAKHLLILYSSIEDALQRAELDAKELEFKDELRLSTEEIGPAWRCSGCGEENPGTFESCWKCQADRAPAASA
jgi:hypothetical protein